MYKSLIKISSVVHVYQAIEKAIYSVFLTKKKERAIFKQRNHI